jgi:hypothetical protein
VKRSSKELAAVALAALLALSAAGPLAMAKPDKPPKPPKPRIELLTVNEQAAVEKRAIKVRVTAKRGAEAVASAHVVVDGYPEDFPFGLGPETRPLKGNDATIRFPLSARKVELISFAAETCRGTSISVEAEVKKRIGRISRELAVPSDC